MFAVPFYSSKIVAREAKYTFTTKKHIHSFRLRLSREKDALAFVELKVLS